MKNFLYVQTNGKSHAHHNLINTDFIKNMYRSVYEDVDEEYIVILDTDGGRDRFTLIDILEVVTNNRCVKRFFENAGIKVDFEEKVEK